MVTDADKQSTYIAFSHPEGAHRAGPARSRDLDQLLSSLDIVATEMAQVRLGDNSKQEARRAKDLVSHVFAFFFVCVRALERGPVCVHVYE